MEEEKDEGAETDKLENIEKKEKIDFTSKFRENPWMLSTLVAGMLILVMLVVNFSGGMTGRVVSSDSAAENLVAYLNTVVDSEITLSGVEQSGDLYKVIIEYEDDEIPVYVTKDGKYYIPSLIPISSDDENAEEEIQDIAKTEKPEVELYVMSFCPFGNRAEETMLPVYNLLKDNVDWNINYIVSVNGNTINSLHGQPEVDQDIREVCVKKEYGLGKFWEFISYINNNCGSDGSCWKAGANSLGIDSNKIQSCFDNEGVGLMKTEAQISGDAGAKGSPTLVINGIKSNSVYQYENSEAYKQAICSAFNTSPEECNEKLAGSTATNSGGSC